MGIDRTLPTCSRPGLKNLWHHRVYTAASVITMSACIFLFGLFYLAAANVDSMVKRQEQEVYVAVFLMRNTAGAGGRDRKPDSEPSGSAADRVCVGRRGLERFKEKYYENARHYLEYSKRIIRWLPVGTTRYILTIGSFVSMCRALKA